MRSIQLKNKISDTSLFAELVKHRHKHESEIKTLETLLEKKNDTKPIETITIPDSTPTNNIDQVDSKAEKKDTTSPVAMDIDDIPIPEERTEVKLNEIALPNSQRYETASLLFFLPALVCSK